MNQSSLTKKTEGQIYRGGEMITIGRTVASEGDIDVRITADSRDGHLSRLVVLQPQEGGQSWSECGLIRRYYAYLQIKQAIKEGTRLNSRDILRKAKKTSLQNNFVTSLTSLVVVIPRSSNKIRVSSELHQDLHYGRWFCTVG